MVVPLAFIGIPEATRASIYLPCWGQLKLKLETHWETQCASLIQITKTLFPKGIRFCYIRLFERILASSPLIAMPRLSILPSFPMIHFKYITSSGLRIVRARCSVQVQAIADNTSRSIDRDYSSSISIDINGKQLKNHTLSSNQL